MKPSETEELSENIEVVTPGDMLREARVALQLSLVDISKKLNLRESLIESIEANEFDEIPSVTFTRGYLKGYAKLLGLSEEDVLEAFEYLNTVEQNQLEMQSFSNRSSQKAADNWLSIVSFLVALVIIALAILWWYQRQEPTELSTQRTQTPQFQQSVNEAEDSSEGLKSDLSEDIADNSNDLTGQDEVDGTPVSLTEQSARELSAQELSAQEQSAPELSAPEQSTQEQMDVVSSDDESSSQISTEETQIEQQQSFDTDEPIAATQNQDAIEEVAPLSQLELHFNDSCWINISDATGKRIAIGTKVKGHISRVEGVAPFSIKLGKPDAVTIYLDGKEKQIPYYPKGSVANFVLPSE